AERVRPHLARAELQAVRGAGGTNGSEFMKQLVVIGNGMAGVACVEQILRYRHDFQITIIGDETHVNYNRILLSSVLAGEKSADDIVLNDIDWYRANSITPRLGIRVTAIDTDAHILHGSDGSAIPFDKLII